MTRKAGAILKNRRKELKISVKEVVKLLSQNQIDISIKTLYGWENGTRQPDADTFLILCKIYGIKSFEPDNLQKKTVPQELADLYNELNSAGQELVILQAKLLNTQPQYKKHNPIPNEEISEEIC